MEEDVKRAGLEAEVGSRYINMPNKNGRVCGMLI
jgi:hypothetical protein